MCLLFVYLNPNPVDGKLKLILVNNRDEVYDRPTKPAHRWNTLPEIIAGMDTMPGREGGTWLGVNSKGRIGCLLNIFQSVEKQKAGKMAEGRGFLTVNYLKNTVDADTYLKSIVESNVVYNDFNLVLLEPSQSMDYKIQYLNFGNQSEHLSPGIHGFGNCPRETPFIKVDKGIEYLRSIVEDTEHDYLNDGNIQDLQEQLFTFMQDREENYPDPRIISQGIGHKEIFLRGLSSLSVDIKAINYGTRTTTIIIVDSNGKIHFHEKTLQEPIDLNNKKWLDTKFEFNMEI